MHRHCKPYKDCNSAYMDDYLEICEDIRQAKGCDDLYKKRKHRVAIWHSKKENECQAYFCVPEPQKNLLKTLA